MEVLLIAVLLHLLAGFAALACARSPRLATAFGAGGAVAAPLVGLLPTLRVLLGSAPESLQLSWDESHRAFSVEVDVLSAFFLLPVLGLAALATIYGSAYLFAYRHERSLGVPWFFFNLFVAGMVMVLVARTALLFLMAWEVMSLAAYFLVTWEHEQAEVRHAGWVYLIATHLGVAFLFFGLVLLGWHAQSLEFAAFRALPPLAAGIVFVLALIGFGAKAGFVPFHVWLPEAHSAAPSHVSALMSGVMIKMGLYGLLRVLTFLGPPALWWGPTLALLGLVTALVGISLSLQQRDAKRVLAYSSIENMGLIALALGLGLSGWAQAQPALAILGVMAALLHVWNHALLKGLMFLAAGSILHATGTRDLERLGGLMKRMPWTAGAMLAGAVALAALPPGNGFVGKWLMYVSLIRAGFTTTGGHSMTALLAVGLLALVGGLAAIAFLRLIGMVLLGAPRSERAANAPESPPWMVGPMLVLVALCCMAAIAPQLVVNRLFGVADQILGWRAGQAALEFAAAEAPLAVVGNVNAWLFVVFGCAALLTTLAWSRRAVAKERPTWGCGYPAPTPRMQYTGRSFVEMIAEHLLPRFLRPHTSRSPLPAATVGKGACAGLFLAASGFSAECADPVSETIYEPFFRRWADRFARLRILQQGKIHIYLIYIFVTVVLALAWLSVRHWWSIS